MDPLLEQFLLEARENLAYIDQHIEDVSSDDDELMNALFRAAHTLKGGSGIVGFEAVKNITHSAEDLLDMLRSKKIEYQESMTEALYSAFDEVMNLVEAAEESEGIVDADETTLRAIVDQLNNEMGKKEEIIVWSKPFESMEVDAIRNLPLGFLENSTQKIVSKVSVIDEEACKKEQLYAVFFDVDASCMVYGNDPIYTLSLIQDKVIGVFTCMSEDAAKGVISGLDDPEGLELKTQIVAYVYATYEEIEDALFNFIDELLFNILDIDTLLGINVGEAQQLDILKELSAIMTPLIASKDREAIKAEADKTLQLVGNETLAFNQLTRLKEVLNMIEDSDFAMLNQFISALCSAKAFVYDENSTSTTAVKEELGEVARDESVIKVQLDEILSQQLAALELNDDEITAERVHAILETIKDNYGSFVESSEIGELKSWIANQLNPQEKSEEVVVEAVSETVVKETVIKEVKVEPKAEAKVEVKAEAEVKEPEPTKAVTKKEPAKKSVVGKTVKIEQESIDNLMNIVGELLVAKNSLPYLAESVVDMNTDMIKRAIMEKYTFINRLSEQLQDLIMSMRMLPISYVFDRYPKLVRDISKNMGKKVTLTMDGGDTKLDKNMIEMLADPMIHIMRNSLDHGVEMPDVREQKGKSANGNVSLKAFAQSDRIIIEIKDDGAGINVDKVIQKVIEKGLLTMEQIDALSDKERAELVLLPGLSTADEITEYSGRGVGMDVVKKSIESFGGTISIETKANQGTVITLAIPVSLAVTSLLHVSMGGIHYGFPMDNVNETVKISRDDIEYLHNEPFVYLRGEVIPLLFVKSMLDESEIKDGVLSIAVLSVKDNLIAVVVNELLGQLDVVQKPLEGVMSHHPLFSGTALLGNGQIIMSIDPLGMLSIAHQLKDEDKKVS